MNKQGCQGCSSKKQSSYDWLSDIPEARRATKLVEVQFKNTRKGYYLNDAELELYKGDLVVVEAPTGYDVGEVTLVGKLVELAIRRHRWKPERSGIQQILRKPSSYDLARWHEAQAQDEPTMIQARQIASSLGLDMKIGDVEYQGDGTRAIFYYIADGRVDFRQLIRVLADTFHIRIEMKQIGARQEAGRIGGIGPCGRELCCASWMSTFTTVNTNAARVQDISSNPQKLTGMCGKIKCCMNHEVQTYAEVQRSLPSREIVLETKAGSYYHFKTDILQRQMTYSKSPRFPEGLVAISATRVFEIIKLNSRGEQPDSLSYDDERDKPQEKPLDILEDNSLTRFDQPTRRREGRGSGSRRRSAQPSGSSAPRREGRERRSEGRERRDNRPPRGTAEGGGERQRRFTPRGAQGQSKQEHKPKA